MVVKKGSGMATNKIKARLPYFSYLPSNLCFVLLKNQSNNLLPGKLYFSTKEYTPRNTVKIKNTGIISPITEKNIAEKIDSL